MDLNKEVNKTVKGLVKSGKVQEIIEKQLEDTIKSIVKDSLKSYSDFGKQIETKLKESLNCTDIEFPDYAAKMADYILTYTDGVVCNEIKVAMDKNVKDFFKPLDYKTIKVSEIIENLKNGIDSYDREDLSDECTAFVSDSAGGWPRLYFDKEEGKDKYNCEYQIALSEHDGKYEVFHIEVGRHKNDLTKSKYAILGSTERMLFQLFSQKIEVIIDADKIDTELYFEVEY